MRVRLVLSGGQTGVDRAALDAAIATRVPYAGWCPAGGRAEDHPDDPGLLPVYPGLRPTRTADPAVRTRLNVRAADAVLVVRRPGVASPGTGLTERVARDLGRALLVTDGADPDVVCRWLASLGPPAGALDVAGPRASEDPAAYPTARALLETVLGSGLETGLGGQRGP